MLRVLAFEHCIFASSIVNRHDPSLTFSEFHPSDSTTFIHLREDLEFETESLSIENFLDDGDDDDEEGDDDDDDGLTIYWDFNM